MKPARFLFAVSMTALSGCSSTHPADNTKAHPETVMVTYHVKAGMEAEFQSVLLRAWQIYRTQHLVFTEPHTVVRDTEDGNKPRFVEIFTWRSHDIPEHAPDEVKGIWQHEQLLCEARSGHTGIEGGEVELISVQMMPNY